MLLQPTAKRLILTGVCFLVGLMLILQFRTQSKLVVQTSRDSLADQAQVISSLYDVNTQLRQEAAQLQSQRASLDSAASGASLSSAAAELARLKAFNGTSDVTGPGVEIQTDAALRPEDVSDLVNELRNAGAEAIAVGDQRVIYSTTFWGTQNRIVSDGVVITAPFVIRAIGAPETIETALTRKGGLISYLQETYPNARFTVSRSSKIVLPAYAGEIPVAGSVP